MPSVPATMRLLMANDGLATAATERIVKLACPLGWVLVTGVLARRDGRVVPLVEWCRVNPGDGRLVACVLDPGDALAALAIWVPIAEPPISAERRAMKKEARKAAQQRATLLQAAPPGSWSKLEGAFQPV